MQGTGGVVGGARGSPPETVGVVMLGSVGVKVGSDVSLRFENEVVLFEAGAVENR